jgi:protein-disulfide isomerase
MKTKISVILSAALLLLCGTGFAADGASLKPPAGAQVAVVVFEDLECPSCANAYPVVWQTAEVHHVPVVLHDFPLRQHPWSMEAAVDARFFDTKSEKLGNDFRGYIYQNQANITPENLHQYVQKFADNNKVPFPFAVDPEGKLKAKINSDAALGQQIGLVHTPTIFVIARSNGPTPYVEVQNLDQLGQSIEDMQKKAAPVAAAPKTSARAHRKVR